MSSGNTSNVVPSRHQLSAEISCDRKKVTSPAEGVAKAMVLSSISPGLKAAEKECNSENGSYAKVDSHGQCGTVGSISERLDMPRRADLHLAYIRESNIGKMPHCVKLVYKVGLILRALESYRRQTEECT